jgi:hypothetical protein
MKRILCASAVLILAILACGQSPRSAPTTTEWTEFTENSFHVALPKEWDEFSSSDEQVIYTVSNGRASLWIKSWPLIPSLVASNVQGWVDENAQASLLEESGDTDKVSMELSIKDHSNVLRLSSLLIYCNAITYEVTGAAPEDDFEQYTSIFKQAKDSAQCDRGNLPPQLESGAVGMVILPKANDKGEFNPADYQQALALARESGVQVSHYYVQWGDVEKTPGVYDWRTLDYILEANYLEGLQVSLVVNVIHTTVIGRVPPDLAGTTFEDGQFSERLAKFLAALADRYEERLNYLSVGNEVNDYFAAHPSEMDAYASAFDQVRPAIHQQHPDLPVGIVFAYHDAEKTNTLNIVKSLNRGDFIAFTLYLYNEGFHFTRDPALIGDYLDRMLDVAEGTPIAIVETGWSTAEFLEGSEASQSEYVRQFFTALDAHREDILFLTWFVLHDSKQNFCYEQALTFFHPSTEPDPAYMDAFVTFLCYFGLRHADGTPKPAWDVWVQEAQAYYQ